MVDFRCGKCNKLLARYSLCHYLEIKCSRCGTSNTINQAMAPGDKLNTRPASEYLPHHVMWWLINSAWSHEL